MMSKRENPLNRSTSQLFVDIITYLTNGVKKNRSIFFDSFPKTGPPSSASSLSLF